MKRVLCLIGKSGVGKTTLANRFRDQGCNVICSFTNRPKRDGEVEGIDHYFTTLKSPTNPVAYTIYGSYEYWTTTDQFLPTQLNVYVIDPAGYQMLTQNKDLECIPVSVVRENVSVDKSRTARDVQNYDLPYKFVVINNGPIEGLQYSVKRILLSLANEHRTSKITK